MAEELGPSLRLGDGDHDQDDEGRRNEQTPTTLNDVRSALQRALDNPHGDAADAEIASRHIRTLKALRAMLPDLDPKPADLIDLEDRPDWICEQLVRAGGRADPS